MFVLTTMGAKDTNMQIIRFNVTRRDNQQNVEARVFNKFKIFVYFVVSVVK